MPITINGERILITVFIGIIAVFTINKLPPWMIETTVYVLLGFVLAQLLPWVEPKDPT